MEATLAIRTNYLQFDSASSLLGFCLAACLPRPWVYVLGHLRKLEEQTAGGSSPPPDVGSSLWEVMLMKVL